MAARPMADGAKPGPGGWNRIHLIVDDLDAEVARLRAQQEFRAAEAAARGAANSHGDIPAAPVSFSPGEREELQWRVQQQEQQLWMKVMQQKTLHAQQLRKYWRTNISVNHTNENVISILRAINCMQQTMHIKIDRKGHKIL